MRGIFLGRFLKAFLVGMDSKKPPLDLKDLVDKILTMMAATYETNITSAVWFMQNMASNPLIQEMLHEELVGSDVAIKGMTASQLNELTLLDQCVRENHRIYPPIALETKKISKELDLDFHSIPE